MCETHIRNGKVFTVKEGDDTIVIDSRGIEFKRIKKMDSCVMIDGMSLDAYGVMIGSISQAEADRNKSDPWQ